MGKTIKFWRHPEPPHHLYQFSGKTIEKLLDKAGFRIVELRYSEIDIKYTAPIRKSTRHILVKLLFRMVYQFIYWVVRVVNRGIVDNQMTIIAKKK